MVGNLVAVGIHHNEGVFVKLDGAVSIAEFPKAELVKPRMICPACAAQDGMASKAAAPDVLSLPEAVHGALGLMCRSGTEGMK